MQGGEGVAIPERFLDELASRTDIVDLVGSYVQLTRRGGRWFGRCPFHSEKTPSFSVLPERDMFYCFGCHAGGGPIQFTMRVENLDYVEAVGFLAKRAGLTVPEERDVPGRIRRDRLLELNRLAARWFYANLSRPEGAESAAYLARRGVSPQTAKRFGLGAAPRGRDGLVTALLDAGVSREELVQSGLTAKNDRGLLYDAFRGRLMFPVFDAAGKVVGFSGRSLDETVPKYKNSAETSLYSKRRTLYGLQLARNAPFDHFLLVEGNLDVVTLHQHGFDSALATCGTALTAEQAKLMARYKSQVVLCYDGDAAGLAAAQKAIPILDAAGLKVRVLRIPGGGDPDDFVRQYGKAAFEELVGGAKGHMEYRLSVLAGRFDLTADAGKIDFLREAAGVLLTIESEAERAVYAARVAEMAGVTRQGVLRDLERAAERRQRRQQKKLQNELMFPREVLDKAEEQVLAHLLRQPELLSLLREPLTPADFADARLQGLLTHILNRGRVDDPGLTPDQAGLMARLLASEGATSSQAFEECVAVVREQTALRRAIQDGEDDLLLKFRLQKDKKSFGG